MIRIGVQQPQPVFQAIGDGARYALPVFASLPTDSVHFGNTPALGKPIEQLLTYRQDPIKLLFIDIDGTWGAHDKDKNLIFDPEASKMLCQFQQNGGRVVVSTGRSYFEAHRIAKEQGLDLSQTFFIVEQGTRLIAPDGQVLYSTLINCDDAKNILDEVEKSKIRPFIQLFSNGTPYVTHPTQMDRYNKVQPLERIHEFIENGKLCDQFLDNPPNKIVFDVSSIAQEQPLIQLLSNKFGEQYHIKRTADHFVELFHKSASKGAASVVLAKTLAPNNFEKILKEAANIGDADNDFESAETLNNYGGVSIAMGNGSEKLKTGSQYITGHVDKGGFAQALKVIEQLNHQLTPQAAG